MTHTKKQKLDWIEKARTDVEKKINKGSFDVYTCNAFYETSGGDAEKWYNQTTVEAMGLNSDLRNLMIAHFGNWMDERNPNRQMWLAMLKTLVEAGEF